MFTKIKAAWHSLLVRISQGMYEMAIEAELAKGITTVEADAAAALKVVVDDVKEIVAKVEGLVETGPIVSAPLIVPMPAVAAPAVSADKIAAVVSKVGDLLALADREVSSFGTYAAYASKAVTGDVDAVLAKLKAVLDYNKVETGLWDEIVAVAKL